MWMKLTNCRGNQQKHFEPTIANDEIVSEIHEPFQLRLAVELYRHTFYPMAVRWNKRAFKLCFSQHSFWFARAVATRKSESGTWNLFKLNSNRHFDWSIRHLFPTSGEKQVRKLNFLAGNVGRQFGKYHLRGWLQSDNTKFNLEFDQETRMPNGNFPSGIVCRLRLIASKVLFHIEFLCYMVSDWLLIL